MLEAVKALHKHGLHHRDLHPRNIMFDEDGNMEIIDFGSAVKIDLNNSSEINRINAKDIESSRLSDDGITIILQKLATTPKDFENTVIENALGQPENLLKKLATKREKIWQELMSSIDQGESLEKILRQYESPFGAESDRKVRIALLLEISRHNRKAEVVDYLQAEIDKNEQKRKEDQSSSLRNQYNHLLKLINS